MSEPAIVATKDRLSMILTLKGREEFTPRWIGYHERVGIPWPVIVGDGSPTERTEKMFRQATRLRATYRRYDDSSLQAYYRKLHDVVAAASTPYVMLTDNDDFVLPDGVARSIEFLDKNSDYVSSSGMMLGCYVTDRRFADEDRIFGGTVYGLHPARPPLDSTESDAEARVTLLLRDYFPTWYAVHRRDALLKALQDLVERKISDVVIMELLVAIELAALGKQKIDWSYCSYLRQLNSSQGASASGRLFDDMMPDSIKHDLDGMVESVSAIIVRGEDTAGLIARLRAEMNAYRDNRMHPPFSAVTKARQWIKRYLHTARAKLPFVHGLLSRSELNSVVSAMRAHGANDDAITLFRNSMILVFDAAGCKERGMVSHAALQQSY